jgi:predicted amidohydrolase
MSDLTITIIQSNLYWESIDANLSMFEKKIASVSKATDLIILPEMFTTGFTMNAAALAEDMEGKTVGWMKKMAADSEAVITGSVIVKEHGKFFNRLIWMQPDGNVQLYDKHHLFSMANEQDTFSAGTQKLIADIRDWKICPQICYDLRFPVWLRNVEKYDLLIFVANWPERRSYPWQQLLIARAIENQCYVAGVNRVGEDGNGISYSGCSAIIDPKGKVLFEKSHQEVVQTITLSKSNLQKTRARFPFLQDGDRFTIVG